MSAVDYVKTTCPRDCYDACGLIVMRNEGAIARVRGDPDHAVSRGGLCGKCAIAYNGVLRNEALRLGAPLRRVGPKGQSRFEPISWEAALAEIASRLRDRIDAGEARTIIQTHYTGTVGLIGGWFPLRLFNRMGATEVDPDTVCNKAGHAVLEMVFGDSLEGFDPRTAEHSRTLLIWGANPSHSAPHQDRVFVEAARKRGAKIIVVDPIGHGTARRADIHLKLIPGSDAALAFGFLHVLREAGLTDERFLSDHVQSWQEMLPAIIDMTPAKAAALCGLDADLIVEAARAYGEGPSLLWLGQGVQRQSKGGNIFRCLSALVAFTGNLAKPGAGFMYMNGLGGRGVDMATLTAPELARSQPVSISHMDLAPTLEDPERAKILVNWNNNPVASSPEQRRLRRALARDDLFHVAVELFHTDTTAYADIVLPAASFLECDDLVLSYFDLTASAQVKASEPLGQSLPNSEIFRRLAAAMGYADELLFESDEDLLRRLLREIDYAGSFDDLAAVGTVTLFERPRLQFADLAFKTPSGRIELVSERAQEAGLPRVPDCRVDERPSGQRLRILSPASQWLMNSSYGNDPAVQRRLGPATVTLHPDEAARRGLAEGDRVRLTNDAGSLLVVVKISAEAQTGVGIVYKGRWPCEAEDNANVNVLVSGRKGDVAESTTVHGVEAEVTRAEAGA